MSDQQERELLDAIALLSEEQVAELTAFANRLLQARRAGAA